MDTIGMSFFDEAYRQVLSAWGNPSEYKRVEMDFCCVVAKNER